MCRRLCLGVVAIFALILSSLVLIGQSDQPRSGARFAPPARVLPPLNLARFPRVRIPGRGTSVSGPLSFSEIARASGAIFSGTVIAVERRPSSTGNAIETVAITFQVDRAIRGALRGERLTISQWIGLWSAGQRYRVGERALLFLYPPSKLGLTSSVAGSLGRLAIAPSGRVELSAQHFSAFRTDPVLGGKSRPTLSDFALAVRRATEGE